MDTKKDIVGNPIQLGDKVATDTMSYRSSSLRIGTLTEWDGKHFMVTYPNGTVRKDGKPGRTSVWRRPEGVVKVAA